MSKTKTYLIIVFSCFVLSGQTQQMMQAPTKTIDSLVAINYNDPKSSDLRIWTHDTTTHDGWTIKYLVKKDSTKYSDLYITWTDKQRQGIVKCPDFLEVKRYFIPTIVGENNSNIFLSYACATNCQALLVLNKDSLLSFKNFIDVVNYNIPLGQIVYVKDIGFDFKWQYFQLSIVDLKHNKEYQEKYEDICLGNWGYTPSCIDSIIFEKDKISISTSLVADMTSSQLIKETRIIKIENN